MKWLNSELKLRRLLAVCYAGSALYKDGGELYDNRESPYIDFLRDTVDKIEDKMLKRAEKAYKELKEKGKNNAGY